MLVNAMLVLMNNLFLYKKRESAYIKFEDIELSTAMHNKISMKEALYQHGFQLLSEVSHDENIQLYSAVVGKSGKILNIGNYLTFDNNGEVRTLNIHDPL